MIEPLSHAVESLLEHRDLSAGEMRAALGVIMDGDADQVQIAALLTALQMKGVVISEVVGAAEAMVERATRIPTTRTGLLDTCGTGGTGLRTFNISTATAIVVAACDVPVAKHGNRAATSPSGSADVLEALGVNIERSAEQVGKCIDEVGIGFCFARLLHGAMKHVAPVRSQLGFRTIFNLLGPLTNPAGAEYQLLGAHSDHNAELIAGALQQLGRRHALVVCGAGQLDEVSLWGETRVFEVTTPADESEGKVRQHTWTAETFGLPECRVEDVQTRSIEQSCQMVRDVLRGEAGPPRNIVLANAAAALIAAEQEPDPAAAMHRAAEAIDSRAAQKRFEQLAAHSQA